MENILEIIDCEKNNNTITQESYIQELIKDKKHLEETIDALLNVQYQLSKSNIKLRKHLVDVKKTLKMYAESTCGEPQPDGRYRIKVKEGTAFDGFLYVFFDPRPAIKALEDLKDVE